MDKIRLGTNEDGSPHYLYHAPGEHLVYTGPNISGPVTLADGSEVDVTELFVVADTPEHALAISDAVGKHFADNGHPGHVGDNGEQLPFVHTPAAVSHSKAGQPAPAFADAVHTAVPAGADSSPQAVLDSLKKKG